MRTLVMQLAQDQFDLIKAGIKNFIVGKFKQTPVEGQRLILQTATDEIDTVITNVHSEGGMIKHWSVICFPAVQKEPIAETKESDTGLVFIDEPAHIIDPV